MRKLSSTTKPFTFKADEKVENDITKEGNSVFCINQKSLYTPVFKMSKIEPSVHLGPLAL